MRKQDVLDALGVTGDQGKSLCPAHEDDKASLSVSLSDEGKILVYCHAGCDQEEVLKALRDTYGITPRDLGNGGEQVRREVARYVYRDGGGQPVFTKIRFEPKDFVIQPAGADTKGVVYNLPAILAATTAKTVVWVEGEKSADALNDLGFLCTTIGGASKSPDQAVKVLKGRRVVILPDNDDAGRRHAEVVSRVLKANGVHVVRILNLPGLDVKGDVVDWLDSGHTAEELEDMVRRAVGVTFAAGISPRTTDWMWNPRIPATGLTLLFGEAGIGKSTMTTDLVARWTRGDPMPETVGGPFKPINVAMFGFEDDRDTVVVPRLMAAGADLSRVAFLELDTTKPVLPDQIDKIRQLCAENEIGVLVLDNVENSMGLAVDANNSKSLRAVLSPLSFIGLPVIAIHHPKKGGFMFGPREAMTGSQAYTNVARSVLEVMMVGQEPDGSQLVALAAVKSNYAPIGRTRTLYFKLESRLVEGAGEQPVVEWVGGDHTTAEQWHLIKRAELSADPANGKPVSSFGGQNAGVNPNTINEIKNVEIVTPENPRNVLHSQRQVGEGEGGGESADTRERGSESCELNSSSLQSSSSLLPSLKVHDVLMEGSASRPPSGSASFPSRAPLPPGVVPCSIPDAPDRTSEAADRIRADVARLRAKMGKIDEGGEDA